MENNKISEMKEKMFNKIDSLLKDISSNNYTESNANISKAILNLSESYKIFYDTEKYEHVMNEYNNLYCNNGLRKGDK